MDYSTTTPAVIFLGPSLHTGQGRFTFPGQLLLVVQRLVLQPWTVYHKGTEGPYNSFNLSPFHFTLTSPSSGNFFKYIVMFGDVSIPFLVLPVDTYTECGQRFNISTFFFGNTLTFSISQSML
jgi:hypothetical protein